MTYTVENLKKDIAEGKKVFPLLTVQTLANRWGIERAAAFQRIQRDSDFPTPVQGVIEGLSHNKRVWPMFKIEEYEQRKELGK